MIISLTISSHQLLYQTNNLLHTTYSTTLLLITIILLLVASTTTVTSSRGSRGKRKIRTNTQHRRSGRGSGRSQCHHRLKPSIVRANLTWESSVVLIAEENTLLLTCALLYHYHVSSSAFLCLSTMNPAQAHPHTAAHVSE